MVLEARQKTAKDGVKKLATSSPVRYSTIFLETRLAAACSLRVTQWLIGLALESKVDQVD